MPDPPAVGVLTGADVGVGLGVPLAAFEVELAGLGVVAVVVPDGEGVLVAVADPDAEGVPEVVLGVGAVCVGVAVPVEVAVGEGVCVGLFVGVGVPDGVGVGVGACSGSHAVALPDAVIASAAPASTWLTWAAVALTAAATSNPVAVANRTPPAAKVDARGRACAKRMNRPHQCCSLLLRNDYSVWTGIFGQQSLPRAVRPLLDTQDGV